FPGLTSGCGVLQNYRHLVKYLLPNGETLGKDVSANNESQSGSRARRALLVTSVSEAHSLFSAADADDASGFWLTDCDPNRRRLQLRKALLREVPHNLNAHNQLVTIRLRPCSRSCLSRNSQAITVPSWRLAPRPCPKAAPTPW